MATSKAMIIHPDNPFKGIIEQAMGRINVISDSYTKDNGDEIMVMFLKRKRTNAFTQFEQRKELLDLTPYACKVLVYIALTIEYNAQQVSLKAEDIGIDRRTLKDALFDLVTHGVIRKADKLHMWWVNVTLIISGTLGK